jgi:hypothetical protein
MKKDPLDLISDEEPVFKTIGTSIDDAFDIPEEDDDDFCDYDDDDEIEE